VCVCVCVCVSFCGPPRRLLQGKIFPVRSFPVLYHKTKQGKPAESWSELEAVAVSES
jgi:hypothetical protein